MRFILNLLLCGLTASGSVYHIKTYIKIYSNLKSRAWFFPGANFIKILQRRTFKFQVCSVKDLIWGVPASYQPSQIGE